MKPRSYKPILIVFLIYTFWFIPSIAGAEIKVQILQAYAVPENVSVNVGDTVTWLAGGPSNIQVVESYTGDWKSPFLTESGSAFSITFDQPGFYPYRFRWYTGPPYEPVGTGLGSQGTVTVVPSTNGPSAVTLNTPVDGAHFGWISPLGFFTNLSEPISILATPTNDLSQITRVEFYGESNILGTATNAPFQITWTNAPMGVHTLRAKAVGSDGSVSDSRSVMIFVDDTPAPLLRSARLLAGRIFLFDFVIPPYIGNYYIHGSGNLSLGVQVKLLRGSGTFISEIGTNQTQFFSIRQRF